MLQYDVVIIGSGAAGMMAAIRAAREGMRVILLEKMERAGRKLLITGKGRCNITNTKDWQDFSKRVYPNPNFLKFAFKSFSNIELVKFLNNIGLNTVVERGERVYPLSSKSQDVVSALMDEIEKLRVTVEYRVENIEIVKDEELVSMVRYRSYGNSKNISVKALILATGGLSYPATGSTGDGYLFSEKLGHSVTERFPSLTALMPANYNRSLVGLILKNISVKLLLGSDTLQSEFGDAEFTNNGFEGPIGLKISRRAVKALLNNNSPYISIDLKPALSDVQLINRIEREFKGFDKIALKELLRRLVPQQLIPVLIGELKMLDTKILSKSIVGEIHLIASLLKNYKVRIESFTGFERCVVTAGGVKTDEIFPKTMGSRLIPNLFFAGELIDIDGDTGGYNLQIAFSTGNLSGLSAAHFIKKSKNSK